MALVRVLTKSYINDAIREEGDVVEYGGKLGSNLELVTETKGEAKGATKKWKKDEADAAANTDEA